MSDILVMLNATKLSYEDIHKLVEETRSCLEEADEILDGAKKNRERAIENYIKALALEEKYIKQERSIK